MRRQKLQKDDKQELFAISRENLQELGRIIGETIVAELMKYNKSLPSFLNSRLNQPEQQIDFDIDNFIIDVGVSSDGLEASFDNIAETQIQEDVLLSTSKDKLAKLKSIKK